MSGGENPHCDVHIWCFPEFCKQTKPGNMPRGRTISDDVIEKLIELVRENPCIFDQSLPEYRDALFIKNVWDSIAEKLDYNDYEGKFDLIYSFQQFYTNNTTFTYR